MNVLKMALIMAKPIKELGLSAQTYRALSISRINNIADIYVYHIKHQKDKGGYGWMGINRIYGIGIKSRHEIDCSLILNGLPTLDEMLEKVGAENEKMLL